MLISPTLTSVAGSFARRVRLGRQAHQSRGFVRTKSSYSALSSRPSSINHAARFSVLSLRADIMPSSRNHADRHTPNNSWAKRFGLRLDDGPLAPGLIAVAKLP